jgi:hypothetical protein
MVTRMPLNYFAQTVGGAPRSRRNKDATDTYGHLMDGDDEKAAETAQEVYGQARKKKGSKKAA